MIGRKKWIISELIVSTTGAREFYNGKLCKTFLDAGTHASCSDLSCRDRESGVFLLCLGRRSLGVFSESFPFRLRQSLTGFFRPEFLLGKPMV